MKKQKGFTLIELIVVMVILAILAAYAIPKFYDFSTQANIAALNGLAGAVASATVTAHGAALASGYTAASGQTIVMEGSTVTLAYGYPTGGTSNAGIGAAVVASSQFVQTVSGTTTTWTMQGKTAPNCSVQYTSSTGVTAAPGITTTTTAC